MFRPVVLAIILVLPATGAAEMTFRDFLDRFIGRWTGELVVRTEEGRVVRRMEVEQRYWWVGDEQQGLGVFDDGQRLSYSSSTIRVDRGRLLSEVSSDDGESRRYRGEIRGEQVTWLPLDVLEASRRQIAERVADGAEGRLLLVRGFERVQRRGSEVTLWIEGRLIYQGRVKE